jgi:hypothetical protein
MLILDPTTGMRVIVSTSVQSSLIPRGEQFISGGGVTNCSEIRASNEAASDYWSRHERTENNVTIRFHRDCLRHTRTGPRNVAA